MDKFDVSKVLTAVTKDNAVLGAYGWFGDSISAVEKHYWEEPPKKLKKVGLYNVFPFSQKTEANSCTFIQCYRRKKTILIFKQRG